MSFMKTTTKIASVLGVAGLALSLAACSGGQSVAEACAVAADTFVEAQEELQSVLPDAMAGEGSMADIFKPIDQMFADAEKSVSNAEVSNSIKNIRSEYSKLADSMGDLDLSDLSAIDPKDVEKVEARTEALTKASEKFQKLCPAS